MTDHSKPSVSAGELRRIIGDLDDATLSRILALAPTAADVLEARQWLSADDALGAEVEHGRHGVAGAIYEILNEIEAPQEP
jgi:hypothetical protein